MRTQCANFDKFYPGNKSIIGLFFVTRYHIFFPGTRKKINLNFVNSLTAFGCTLRSDGLLMSCFYLFFFLYNLKQKYMSVRIG